MSLSNCGAKLIRGILCNATCYQGIRSLYSAASLGIDNYIATRNKVSLQFESISEKFRSKMSEYLSPGSNSLIFTEDLKHMVHLVDGSDNDMSLLERMITKFSMQNKEVRFGSFVFGPVVMRMYHYFNKPKEALEIFLNPDTDGFFDQLISFQILMDLLYENKMYDETLKVFDIVSEKQLLGSKYPKNCVVLVLAACYKMNTQASFDYMKKLWGSLLTVGHVPMRRAATFAAALALFQDQPAICLEILASLKHPTYVTVRNLKVSALSALGRPDDSFPLLRSVLEVDVNRESRNTFSEEAINKLRVAVQKTGNKDIISEFERIEKQLKANNHITSSTIDLMLCQEIVRIPRNVEAPRQQNYQQKEYRDRNLRPSLRDIL